MTKFHGLTTADLRSHIGDDIDLIDGDEESLHGVAHAIRSTMARQAGRRPPNYTATTVCANCGPVFIFEGVPDAVMGCPWCFSNGPIPRPVAMEV